MMKSTDSDNAQQQATAQQQSPAQQQSQAEPLQQELHQQQIAAGSVFPKIPLPAMTDGNIEAYFMSLDFWFTASGVRDDNRRYNTVMAQVPPMKLLELRPIIDALPNLNRYVYIKQRLINHFADSQQKRLHRVLSDMPLGDSKPSKLFYDMVRTANGALSDAVIVDLWATRLPSHAQAAVVASQGTTAEQVRIADAVTESMNMRSFSHIDTVPKEINASNVSAVENCRCPDLAALRSEIAVMFQDLNRSRNSGRNLQRNRNGSRGRSSSQRRSTSVDDFEHCWYHRMYGSKARACRQPCSYKKPTNTSQ